MAEGYRCEPLVKRVYSSIFAYAVERLATKYVIVRRALSQVLMVLWEVGRAKLFPRELVPGGLRYHRVGGFVKLKLYTVWNYN